jgi:hypothetical protein
MRIVKESAMICQDASLRDSEQQWQNTSESFVLELQDEV